jgi:beta-lactamase regulating signal transducer with metallopeptidase domain
MTQTEIVSVLATASIKSAAILSLAGLVNALWRSSSASSRHLVWTIGIAAALATPALSLALKQLNAPAIHVGAFVPPVEPVATPVRTNVSVLIDEPPPATVPPTIVRSPEPNLFHSVAPITVPDVPAPMTAPRTPVLERIAQLIEGRLFYLWLAGALAALLPLLGGMARVRLLSRRVTDIDDSRWRDILRRTPQISHLADRVKIVGSESASMPMTWGIFEPTLLVPANSGDWPEWKCRNILLHELAHVERRDCLTQLLAQVACSVYWFNPLVWIAAHRMRVERELACDDRVISAGSPASDYAANLLDVARSLRAPSFTSPTAIAMARPSQLSGRLLAVLDATRNRGSVSRRLRAGISASAAAIVIPMSFIIPGAEGARPATIIPSHKTAASSSQRRAPLSFQTPVASAPTRAPSSSVFVSVSTGDDTPVPFSVQQGTPCWANEGSSHNHISTSNNQSDGGHDRFDVRYSTDNCSLEVTADGKFTLRPDLSDLESISSDGWFRVEERLGRDSKRIEIRRGNNGSLDHQYWVNGDRTPYNDEARAWLARTLLSVERKTAVAASTRVPQLYKSGGLRGLMSEIAQMESPYAKSIYYKTFLDMGVSLDANILNSVVKQATTDLSSSDYYLAEVLSEFSQQPSMNESTWRTFAEAAGTMKSDYYKAEVLKKVLNSGRLSSGTVGILLSSASGIKSDYYIAEILQGVASKYAVNAETRQYYVDALRHVQSDYYRGQILATLNRDGAWDARTSSFVLTSVSDIKSDYYRSEALGSLVKEHHVSDWPAFFNSVLGISSDYYKRETLSTVLHQTPLTRDQVSGVLLVATKMKSDNDISEVLSEVANNYRIDDNMRPAFEKAIDAIGSDYYRGNAMSALRRSMAR